MFNAIYNRVKEIPKGKVVSYGAIAKDLGTNPRIVGFALHANNNKNIPCHRVVSKEGRLAVNYAFGGIDKQRKKLKNEGVMFKDDIHVDLKQSGWMINNIKI